jgi:tetratricopeptide (TPR) repeat protein
VYSLDDENEKAIECFDKCIDINPIESLYYLNKGRCLLNLKKHVQAIQVLNICLLLDKQNADANCYRGICVIFYSLI